MKKNLFTLLGLALGVFAIGSLVQAALPSSRPGNFDNSPYISKSGSVMKTGSRILAGGPSADSACTGGFVGSAIVAITAGDVLIGVSSTGYPRAVSKSATGGVATVIGIALTDALYGANVDVCTAGFALVKYDPGLVVTYDMFVINSATGGAACSVSQTSDDWARGVSQTAIIGRAKRVVTTTTADNFIDTQLLNH